MKHTLKYAALNFSIPSMLVLELMFLGAFAEGTLNRVVSLLVCVGLVCLIRAAWQEVLRMEAQAKQAKRTKALRAQYTAAQQPQNKEAPALRVA